MYLILLAGLKNFPQLTIYDYNTMKRTLFLLKIKMNQIIFKKVY